MIGEIIAPICLLIGFRTRIAGLIVAINMFMAIFLVLREKIFTLNAGGGWMIELEVLFLLGALHFSLQVEANMRLQQKVCGINYNSFVQWLE